MKQKGKPLIPSGVWCITSVVVLFGYLGIVMGVPNMLESRGNLSILSTFPRLSAMF